MKKILLIIVTLLTAIMATFALASCGGKGDCFESDKNGSGTSLSICVHICGCDSFF